MSYTPQNPNGQATSAASAPVVVASDNIIKTQVGDGTNYLGVISPGTANSTANAIPVGATTLSAAFSYVAITAGTTYDVGNYRSVSVQVTSQYSASTITFQGSNDGTNWYSVGLYSVTSTGSTGVASTTTAAGMWSGPLLARYFRINVTGTYTSGTCAGIITFSSGPGTVPPTASFTTFVAPTRGSGNITSASTSLVSSAFTAQGGMAWITVSGTYAGVSFGINISDNAGGVYYPINIYDVAAQTWLPPGTTITPGTNATKSYWIPVTPTTTTIRVLASAWSSGTAAIGMNPGPVGGNPGATLVQPHSVTSAAVPANAFYIGGNNAGNLNGVGASPLSADAMANTITSLNVVGADYLFNGSTWDRQRGNTTGVIVASGTTTTQTAVALTTYNADQLLVVINISAGAGSLVVAVNGVTSSSYSYPILTSTSLSGVNTYVMRIFPSATPNPNSASNDVVPRNVTVTATVTGTITYGIDYVLGG